MPLSAPASAQRRAYLRTVSLGVPGLLLTGWAPAITSARSLTLVVPREMGPVSSALRAGVEMGVDDVREVARLLGVSLSLHRDGGVLGCREAVAVVGADEDRSDDRATSAPTRIHACRLARWRRGAWSVASPLSATRAGLDWHGGLRAHGAGLLNDRFARRAGVAMDERAWHGWMAVKVAFEVALRASAGEPDIRALRFDGHKGQPLRFGEDGHLVQPTYPTS